MAINWDIVNEIAKRKADGYAGRNGAEEGTPTYCERYNGYHAGYMEDAAERESLRTINARLEKKAEKPELRQYQAEAIAAVPTLPPLPSLGSYL